MLQRVEAGAHCDEQLSQQLDASRLAGRDRALATRLVYGTVAQQGFLDHVLEGCLRQPLTQLDRPVLVLLRLGLFQMCGLDRVPTFAAVDTAVELAKEYRGGAATGLVNAALRRAATAWPSVELPALEVDPIGHLSLRHSHPSWLVERLVQSLGVAEAEAFLRADNDVAPTVLRARRGRIDAAGLIARLAEQGIEAEPGRWAPDAVVLAAGNPTTGLDVVHEGLCSVQGEASQLVAWLAAPRPGMAVLDLCAAPGGKTCAMAEQMEDRGRIVAIDRNPKGIDRLRREATRLGLQSIQARVGDGGTFEPADDEPRRFDVILLDAPCSGFGTLRQHPEIRWRRGADDVRRLAEVQARLLDRAVALLEPHGCLVYATCTVLAEENERQVEAACRRHGLRIESAAGQLPAAAAALVDGDGCLRTYPHRHGLDGFYAARLRFAAVG